MSVKKSKPSTPRMLEDEDLLRFERSRKLIRDAQQTVRRTRQLLKKSLELIEQLKKNTAQL